MCDDDDGDSVFVVEVGDDVEDFGSVRGVEVSGGFVGEEDGGFFDEGAGDADALLLTAGEFGWSMVGAVTEADEGQGVFGAVATVGPVAVHHGEFDVGECGETWEEIVGLEYEADFSAADVGEAVVGHCLDCLAVDVVGAFAGYVEASDDVHEGGFAGTGDAHDGDVFAVVYVD